VADPLRTRRSKITNRNSRHPTANIKNYEERIVRAQDTMATLEALEVAITLGHLNQNEATGQYLKIIEGTSWHTPPGGLTALHQMRRGLYDDQRSRGGGSMAPITRIEIRLITSNHAGAGTIGPVYVGVCRREFGINNSDLDFTPGHDFTYVFGEGANVIDAADNDPRTLLPLVTNDATQFPRYIRQESSDAWDLEEIGITLNPGQPSQVVLNALVGPNQHLVLGGTTGKVLYL
jgi:hypothetical protein